MKTGALGNPAHLAYAGISVCLGSRGQADEGLWQIWPEARVGQRPAKRFGECQTQAKLGLPEEVQRKALA